MRAQFNKIYDKIMAGAMAGGIKTVLFKKALAAKMDGLRQGYLEHPLWDKLVFSKIGKRVGLDRCRLMLTGSAPIAAHVLDFLRVAFICTVQVWRAVLAPVSAWRGLTRVW